MSNKSGEDIKFNSPEESYNYAIEQSKKYFGGNELSATVYVDKYALRDNEGYVLEPTPDYMHDRLASEFARIDSEKYGLDYDEQFAIYREAMDKFARIVPQGSPMAAIGNPYQLMSASNCVVVASPEDDMGSIVDSAKNIAQLSKRRTGCGIDISTLRPEGMHVNNAAKTTSGAWSFADLYSFVTRMVGQLGRRGALLVSIDVHHPDVVKFATMKHDLTKVTGANISIKLSDEFLKAVENDAEYEQRWPVEGESKVKKMIRAREVWNVIVDSATKTAEPGLFFWDTIIKNLPADVYPQFKTITTNPCGEICLSPFDSCRLISINLTGYVRNAFDKDNAYFDYTAFKNDIITAMRMSDNLVDLEIELVSKIIDSCNREDEKELWNKLLEAGKNGRRTGLGTHGLADALAQLCVKYDGEDGINTVDLIYNTFRDTAYEASIELAQERGSFPVYDYKLEEKCEFIKRLPKDIQNKLKRYGRRNIALLTQAPTGSVSIVSKVGEFDRWNVSSGIEPVFRNFYTRRKKINYNDDTSKVDFVDVVGDKWQEYTVYHSNVDNYIEKFGNNELPDYFVTSDQISWENRIKLQGILTQYIDHSISNTVNLPKGTTPETVGGIYLKAWKDGCKGVTVYVDGSRDGVLITSDDKSNNQKDEDGRPTTIQYVEAPKRPKELECNIHHASVKGTKWTILVGLMDGKPYEIFAGHADNISLPSKISNGKIVKVKKGKYNLHVDLGGDDLIIKDIVKTFDNPECAWATRMISTSLRHGVSIEFICDQLSRDGGITDINRVISRALKQYIKDGSAVKTSAKCDNPEGCDNPNLVYSEGCVKCLNCLYSKCN